jgi:hypothetical protein
LIAKLKIEGTIPEQPKILITNNRYLRLERNLHTDSIESAMMSRLGNLNDYLFLMSVFKAHLFDLRISHSFNLLESEGLHNLAVI